MRFLLFLALAGCVGDGTAPELALIEDQRAVIGHELRIELSGSDPDGDRLAYTFEAPSTLADIASRTAIAVTPSGAGMFRWTPIGADLGAHAFDFTVSDGTHASTTTINIDVIASATAPIFRAPPGTGTTLDLAHQSCLDLAVAIEDADTAIVKLSQEEPAIAGATLTLSDPMHATWHWCPSPAQRAMPRHTLVLGADDGHAKTIKHHLVILRGP